MQRYGPLAQDTSSEPISMSLRFRPDTAQRGKDSH